jgi:Raf kinase inhibitor-like YbhB/YbcL family protein
MLAIVALLVCGCDSATTPEVENVPGSTPGDVTSGSGEEGKTMQLTSNFQNGARIDKKHTGEGPDVSPPLAWTGAPAGTQSLALICDDPDAPSPQRPSGTPWVHWVIYNIPATASELPEGVSPVANPESVPGAQQGFNSWGSDTIGYRGPMPPPGSGTHRYFFKLYALDTQLDVAPEAASKDAVLAAIEGHVLAEGQLVGTYER